MNSMRFFQRNRGPIKIGEMGSGMKTRISQPVRLAVGGLMLIAAVGCSKLVSTATNGFANALSSGILNQNDLETVRDGAPAYLLLVDGFIVENPNNEALLLAGADLYSSYAGAFVDDPERSRRLAERGKEYGRRALCLRTVALCEAVSKPHSEFVTALESVRPQDLRALYGFAASWATWIQLNPGDWNAIAEIPKVEAAMLAVVERDSQFRRGWPYLYLGVVSSQLPPAFGGKPEQGREYFETALEQSDRRNLMVQVMFAQEYARLVFDKELHDRLLHEVIEAPGEQRNLTLINTLAKERAARLLGDSDEYF